jgi:hypothetical protein
MRQTVAESFSTDVRPPAAPHLVGDRPSVLQRILDPGVNLSLWRRPVEAAIVPELSCLDVSDLPDIRCRTSASTFDDDLCSLLRQQHLDPSVLAHWRIDLERLAALFFVISDRRDATLRLETTDHDGCPRFHTDQTHLRMLCTYRGPGTEWLTDAQVDRVAQANGGSNDRIIRFGEPSRFESFWVGVMKGDAYPGNAGHGLVHRSPPIAGTGQTRVLFCMDC